MTNRLFAELILPALLSAIMIALAMLGGVYAVGLLNDPGYLAEQHLDSDPMLQENLLGQVRDALGELVRVGALICWVVSLFWFVSLFLNPIETKDEAAKRTPIWAGMMLLGVVAFGFLAFFRLGDAAVFERVDGMIGTMICALGVIGFFVAYWLATFVATPGVARTAVLAGGSRQW
jgi:hypothetical protein